MIDDLERAIEAMLFASDAPLDARLDALRQVHGAFDAAVQHPHAVAS